MRRILVMLAALIATLALASSAQSRSPASFSADLKKNYDSIIWVFLYEVNGQHSGAGATIHCGSPYPTVISDYQGFGECRGNAGATVAIYAEFVPDCFYYYWGRQDAPGYGVWRTYTTQGGVVEIYMNYWYRWCG